MVWQATPYTVPLLTAGLVSFALAGYVVHTGPHGSRRLARWFVGVALGTGTWALAYAGQLSATTLGGTLVWNRFVWIGVGALAVAWPAFVLAYTDRGRWLRPRRLALLAAVPTTVVAAVWLLGPAELFYLSPSLTALDGYLVLSFTPGPALVAFIAYTYVLNLVTFGLLGHVAVRNDGVLRRQATLLLVAGVFPTAVGAAGLAGVLTPTLIDVTPLAFSVTSLLVAGVLLRHRLLDITPVARDTAFANLADGVVVVDGSGRVVDVNESAGDLFPRLSVGETVGDVFESSPSVTEAIDGYDPEQETRVAVDSGTDTRVLSVSVHPLDRSGEAVAGGSGASGPVAGGSLRGGAVVLFRDVTERETLQRRYRALIETSPNVIAVVGNDGLVRYVSPSVERILGHDPSAMEGRPAVDLVHDDDRMEVQRAVERTFDAGGPRVVEHRLRHADGHWRTFETTVERLGERTDEVVVTATDVTESRRYEQRLQVLNRVLRHDLKNDVNVIGGYADLLRDHVDEDGLQHLDVIDRKVRTLTHLSDQARQIDVALHSDSQRAEIDLAVLLPELCDALETSFPVAEVSVSTPNTAVVSADALLESALRNVLENAVVHNDSDTPTVEVTVDEVGDRYRVVVDNGPGVPPRERRVFTERRETPLEHASGLGLWLVHWIVTESGGDLAIDGLDAEHGDRGTRVEIRLPAA